MSIIKNSTLVSIKNQIATKNGYLQQFVSNYASNPWDIIQLNVKAGLGESLYPVGTEFTCTYTYGTHIYDFIWVVVAHQTVTWSDSSTHPGLILQAKYAPNVSIQFDAIETVLATEQTAAEGVYYCGKSGTTYTMLELSTGDSIPYSDYDYVYKNSVNDVQVFKIGYGRYKMSAVRQWLNGSAADGEWWTSQHTGDTAPSGSIDGFISTLDSDFVSVITPVQVDTVANESFDGGVLDTVYDKFWLPSATEMYGVPGNNAVGLEGTYYPYWKTKTGLDNPSNSANSGRIIKAINDTDGDAVTIWLRTCKNSNVQQAWDINTTGMLYPANAYTGAYTLPVCAIS